MSTQSELQASNTGGLLNNRWFQLVIALIMMMMISGSQYAWSLYSSPLKDKLGVSLPVIQYAFTMFVILETVSQPVGGWFVDKFGTKVTFISAIFVGLGWAMMGQVNSAGLLAFLYAVVGTGCGIVYGTCVSVGQRWFPDRRGFASGIIAAGFGAGALPFLPFIGAQIKASGPSSAFITWGIIEGIIIAICSLMIKFPASNVKKTKDKKVVKEGDFTPGQMLKTVHFWIIYIVMLTVNFGGLLITANSAPYAKALGFAAIVSTVASITTAANGTARFGWGWISDKLGRTNTMGVSFGLNAVILFILPHVASTSPAIYALMIGLAILTWGQCYSLFPPINTELFGDSYSTVNYGIIYSAKGLAGVFGGGFGAYVATTYGWTSAFTLAGSASLLAAVLGYVVLPRLGKPKLSKPMQSTLEPENVVG